MSVNVTIIKKDSFNCAFPRLCISVKRGSGILRGKIMSLYECFFKVAVKTFWAKFYKSQFNESTNGNYWIYLKVNLVISVRKALTEQLPVFSIK